MIITRSGQMIRMPVNGISVIGRNTQGVRLVNLQPAEGESQPDVVAAVTRVVSEDDSSAAPVAGSANGAAPADAEAEAEADAGTDADPQTEGEAEGDTEEE